MRVEGVIEVADPKTYQPRKLFVKFIHERKDGSRVTAGTHRGGVPVRGEGNQFHYRSAFKAPKMARQFLLEVRQDEAVIATANVVVVEEEKKTTR